MEEKTKNLMITMGLLLFVIVSVLAHRGLMETSIFNLSLQDMMQELELKKIPHFFISHNGEKIANIQTSNPDTLESFLDEYLPQNE